MSDETSSNEPPRQRPGFDLDAGGTHWQARPAWPPAYRQKRRAGPKGWRKSDERVYEDVCEALARDGRVDASDIVVTVNAGEVMLEGTVADRASKRLAERIAETVSGVREVHNHLRLRHLVMGSAELDDLERQAYHRGAYTGD